MHFKVLGFSFLLLINPNPQTSKSSPTKASVLFSVLVTAGATVEETRTGLVKIIAAKFVEETDWAALND